MKFRNLHCFPIMNLTKKRVKIKNIFSPGQCANTEGSLSPKSSRRPFFLCQIGTRINSVSIRLILGSSKFNFRFTDSTESASFEKDAELNMLMVFACNTVASSFSNWLTEKESVTLFIRFGCLVLFTTLLFTN